jgi:alpha-glucosidase
LILSDIRFLGAPEPVLAFLRDDGDEALLCAFNLGCAEMSVDLPAVAGVEPLDGNGLAGTIHGGSLRLPPTAACSLARAGQGRLNRRLR